MSEVMMVQFMLQLIFTFDIFIHLRKVTVSESFDIFRYEITENVHKGFINTTSQLHSTKSELRFYAGSNPARGVSEIRDSEDL